MPEAPNPADAGEGANREIYSFVFMEKSTHGTLLQGAMDAKGLQVFGKVKVAG